MPIDHGTLRLAMLGTAAAVAVWILVSRGESPPPTPIPPTPGSGGGASGSLPPPHLAPLPAPRGAPAASPKVGLRIVREADSAPIDGAILYAVAAAPDGSEVVRGIATSDSDGWIRTDVAGVAEAVVSADGYVPAPVRPTLLDSLTTSRGVEVRLEVEPVFRGRVLLPGGEPAPGAEVSLIPLGVGYADAIATDGAPVWWTRDLRARGIRTRTSDDGTFRVPLIPGARHLAIESGTLIWLPKDENEAALVSLPSGSDFRLRPWWRIRLRPPSETPPPGAGIAFPSLRVAPKWLRIAPNHRTRPPVTAGAWHAVDGLFEGPTPSVCSIRVSMHAIDWEATELDLERPVPPQGGDIDCDVDLRRRPAEAYGEVEFRPRWAPPNTGVDRYLVSIAPDPFPTRGGEVRSVELTAAAEARGIRLPAGTWAVRPPSVGSLTSYFQDADGSTCAQVAFGPAPKFSVEPRVRTVVDLDLSGPWSVLDVQFEVEADLGTVRGVQLQGIGLRSGDFKAITSLDRPVKRVRIASRAPLVGELGIAAFETKFTRLEVDIAPGSVDRRTVRLSSSRSP